MTPHIIDRGVPLTPDEVCAKVLAKRRQTSPPLLPQLERAAVVVHPAVAEDMAMVADAPGAARITYSLSAGELRCCGLVVDTDPSLRYDEARLRREETL